MPLPDPASPGLRLETTTWTAPTDISVFFKAQTVSGDSTIAGASFAVPLSFGSFTVLGNACVGGGITPIVPCASPLLTATLVQGSPTGSIGFPTPTNLVGIRVDGRVPFDAVGLITEIEVRVLQVTESTLPEDIRMQIEQGIGNCNLLVNLFLPERFGGRLEDVADIVENSIRQAGRANIPTNRAKKSFRSAKNKAGLGEYEDAFIEFCRAYNSLSRRGGLGR